MRSFLLLLVTILCGKWGHAQNTFFAQYNYAIPETVPARIGENNYASATLLYKNQQLAGPDQYISSLLFVRYPVVNRHYNRLVLGLTFVKNNIKGPGHLTEQGLTTTVAYSFHYRKHAGIAFAMDVGLINKKIDMNDIRTGSMWTIENGFDPTLSSGENIAFERFTYPKINASLFWYANDKHGNPRGYFGVGVFQMNRFRDSFYNNSATVIESRFSTIGGVRLYNRNKIALLPKFNLLASFNRFYTTVGIDISYSLSKFAYQPNYKDNSLNIEFNYQIYKGVKVGVQYLQPHYVLGMAYHIDMGTQISDDIYNNAVEVLLLIRSAVDYDTPQKRYRRRMYRKQKAGRAKRKTQEKSIYPPQPTATPQVPASNPDTTILNSPDSTAIAIKDHQQDSVGADNLQKLLLALGNENSIQFSFNSAEINEQSMRKLEQLAGILKEYPRTTVILVGHTDNIGSTRQNKILSMQRARAAADVLVALGVAHSQIIVQGRGASEPIASNATEEGRSKNRRIEFFIINE